MINFHDQVPRPKGTLTLNVYECGRLVETWDGENIIVAQSRGQNARLWGGDVTNRSVARIGFGTNGSTPSIGNTGLTGAFTKAIDGVSYPTASSVQFAFTLSTSEANGLAIFEFGLLTGAGVLMARRVRLAPLNKTSDIALSGLWKIEF